MERSETLWRCKESLDLLSDVLFADELSNDHLQTVAKQLGFLMRIIDVPALLEPGRRAVQAKSIIKKYLREERARRLNDLRQESHHA